MNEYIKKINECYNELDKISEKLKTYSNKIIDLIQQYLIKLEQDDKNVLMITRENDFLILCIDKDLNDKPHGFYHQLTHDILLKFDAQDIFSIGVVALKKEDIPKFINEKRKVAYIKAE